MTDSGTRAERLARRFEEQPAPITPPVGSAGRGARGQGEPEASWDEANMRYTIWLPRFLVSEIKAAAKRRDESVAQLVSRAVRAELDRLR